MAIPPQEKLGAKGLPWQSRHRKKLEAKGLPWQSRHRKKLGAKGLPWQSCHRKKWGGSPKGACAPGGLTGGVWVADVVKVGGLS